MIELGLAARRYRDINSWLVNGIAVYRSFQTLPDLSFCSVASPPLILFVFVLFSLSQFITVLSNSGLYTSNPSVYALHSVYVLLQTTRCTYLQLLVIIRQLTYVSRSPRHLCKCVCVGPGTTTTTKQITNRLDFITCWSY